MTTGTTRKRMEWDRDNGNLVVHVSEMVEMLPEEAKRSLVRAEIVHRDVIKAVVDAAVRGGRHAYLWLDDDRRFSDWMGGAHLGKDVRERLLPLMDRAAFLLVGQYREDAAEYRQERDNWRDHAKALAREHMTREERRELDTPGYTHLRYGEDEGEEAVGKLLEALGGAVPYFCPTCGDTDLLEPGESPPCSDRACSGKMVEVLLPDPHPVPVLDVRFSLRVDDDGPLRSARMRCITGKRNVKDRIKRLWGHYPDDLKIRCLGPDVQHSTRVREMLNSRVMAESRNGSEPVVGTLVVAEPRRHEFRCEIEDDDGECHVVHVSRIKSVENAA